MHAVIEMTDTNLHSRFMEWYHGKKIELSNTVMRVNHLVKGHNFPSSNRETVHLLLDFKVYRTERIPGGSRRLIDSRNPPKQALVWTALITHSAVVADVPAGNLSRSCAKPQDSRSGV